MSSLMGAASLYEKMNATPTEKQAIDSTQHQFERQRSPSLRCRHLAYEFESLLNSQLFESVIHYALSVAPRERIS